MPDDNQIFVPPSFIALYTDARQRLRAPAEEVRERYGLCEDLATLLVDQAQTLYHVQLPSEEGILREMHRGLQGPGAVVSPAEATWVVSRLAELLGWACPALSEVRGADA
ncbi:MAG: hypothetical protein PHI55_12830 [Burkholderiaceae bacterium]|nr:hypothetical protein [Burkholderiaceae bacterium]